MNGRLIIKPGYQKDLSPKNNQKMNIIPQIMTNKAEEFLYVVDYIKGLGYSELNWNLGCPYPMVTNKCLGSGLISSPDRIDAILDKVYADSDITISMKMRMGYENSSEILSAFTVLDKYPLKNIGIHARIGKQLYKGGVDLDSFEKCISATKHKLYYNGDITSVEIFRDLQNRFPQIDHWMIGRGLIADPFLPAMIKSDTVLYPENKIEVFSKFHDRLYSEYEQKLTGEKAVIFKMLSYWKYFANLFPNPTRIIKKIKKAKTQETYDKVVAEVFTTELSML